MSVRANVSAPLTYIQQSLALHMVMVAVRLPIGGKYSSDCCLGIPKLHMTRLCGDDVAQELDSSEIRIYIHTYTYIYIHTALSLILSLCGDDVVQELDSSAGGGRRRKVPPPPGPIRYRPPDRR